MRLTFLGVRGSTPEPDPACTRYGGHTSCVAVHDDGAELPTLVLDAGTGIRGLTALLPDGVFRGAIVITHLHWDHMHGLPFAAAINKPECEVDLRLPVEDEVPESALRRAMSPPLFPIGPEGLIGGWTFGDLPGQDAMTVGGLRVRTVDVEHKGARTCAIRVDSASTSVAYLPDHRYLGALDEKVIDVLSGVELLVHGGQFLPEDAQLAHDYGHSTTDDAVDVATKLGAGALVLTHHAPGRTDEQLDALAARLQDAPLPVSLARQGSVVELGG